ncbi:hypothetical protein K443DRAFT_683214, partial [Laccaria amethystina LaAM-08-1]
MQISNMFTCLLRSANGSGFTQRRPVIAAGPCIARSTTPSSVPASAGLHPEIRGNLETK